MDKWDELTQRIQQAILAEEPEAATAAGFQVICEFGRVLERIASTLENRELEISSDDGIPPELQYDEPRLEHDL